MLVGISRELMLHYEFTVLHYTVHTVLFDVRQDTREAECSDEFCISTLRV